MPSHWIDYIDAAYRKIDIAAFNGKQLKIVLAQDRGSNTGRPDIPAQAFFEGAVVATVAAIDQVAQATNSALSLGLGPGDLFDGASSEIEKRVPEFKDWREHPIGRDLRRLRTRMVHYSYTKSSNGEPTWQVEVAYNNYTGPRDLSAYADAAIAYVRELGVIAEKLKESLTADSTSAS